MVQKPHSTYQPALGSVLPPNGSQPNVALSGTRGLTSNEHSLLERGQECMSVLCPGGLAHGEPMIARQHSPLEELDTTGINYIFLSYNQ
jgi:hypothetical protein